VRADKAKQLHAMENPGYSSQPWELSRAAKRPLNSWLAFRCYYSPIFTSFQQKDISGFLTRMWSEDLFRAKWTIVAKAYSVIRDTVGKNEAPLNDFLQIVCPLICLIGPAEYLDLMGWVKPLHQHLEINRRFLPHPNQFSTEQRTTNLSVEDIVQHCIDVGYHFNPEDSNFEMDFDPEATPDFDFQNTAATPDSDFDPQNTATADHSMMSMVAAQPATDDLFSFFDETPSMDMNDIQENDFLLAASGDTYPFNDQFEPEDFTSTRMGLWLDPVGGDMFEAFDITNLF
jgi:hypothetical protein